MTTATSTRPTTYVDVTRTYTDGEIEHHRYVWSGWEPEAAYRHQLDRRRNRRGYISTDPATRTITTRGYAAESDEPGAFRVDWTTVSPVHRRCRTRAAQPVRRPNVNDYDPRVGFLMLLGLAAILGGILLALANGWAL